MVSLLLLLFRIVKTSIKKAKDISNICYVEEIVFQVSKVRCLK